MRMFLVLILGLAFSPASFAKKYPDCGPDLASNSRVLDRSLAYPNFFREVQLSGALPDSKKLPDLLARTDLSRIMEIYERSRPTSAVQVQSFVQKYFYETPAPLDTMEHVPGTSLKAHIQKVWDGLSRPADSMTGPQTSLLPLPYPYIVPGGRFREIYYWDSYFTMLGLIADGKIDMFKNMVRNFNHIIHTYGHVPNGNRTYYLSRSQPPVFALMVALWQKNFGTEDAVQFLPALRKEYAYWMDGARELKPGESHRQVTRLADGGLLNRYWDDLDTPRPEAYKEDLELAHQAMAKHNRQAAEVMRNIRAAAASGWDFSSRWFEDPDDFSTIQTTSLAPVDLNSLMFFMEQKISELSRASSDIVAATQFERAAKRRSDLIRKYMWDSQAKTFSDYNFVKQQISPQLTIAMTVPLFVGLATPAEAQSVGQLVQDQFLRPGGVATTLRSSDQQWDTSPKQKAGASASQGSANGWAPLQWFTYAGLKRYGINSLAEQVRSNWRRGTQLIYDRTGNMLEKQNVDDPTQVAGGGEYHIVIGFGWATGMEAAFADPEVHALDHLGFTWSRPQVSLSPEYP